MSTAFGVLRLSSADFWRMTPREFARALAPFVGEASEAPTRAAFEALATRFPD